METRVARAEICRHLALALPEEEALFAKENAAKVDAILDVTRSLAALIKRVPDRHFPTPNEPLLKKAA